VSAIREQFKRVQDAIAAACARVSRPVDSVRLVAVSKTHSAERLLEAAAAGAQHFGENRVEEAQIKIPQVTAASPHPLTWHMIGHIQSRKAKEVVPLFNVVHSIDTLRLAEKLARIAAERGEVVTGLVEVNISGEASKSGVSAFGWEKDAEVRAALLAEIRAMCALPGLSVRGLMTMAPLTDDPETTRPVFAGLARLKTWLEGEIGVPLPELSMGMTDDFPIAIEEGATLVRIGRAIFGERA
jgi:pyridoxal phosphate enzyme (YggS family)